MAPAADVDVAKLHAALDERVDGEVRFDPGTLGNWTWARRRAAEGGRGRRR